MTATLAPRRARPVEIAVLARQAGVAPELTRRFVALGLLDRGYTPDAAARGARAARLRRDLALNSAGAVLACELLARIDELERRLSRYEPR
jgi:hypothetical protein